MLLDALSGLQGDTGMGIRIIGNLSPSEQERAIKLLEERGALEDSRNRYVNSTKLWCGHDRKNLVEVSDGKSGKTQICAACEPEPEAVPYMFHPFNVRKPK